ncbi:MAG: DUF2911 domain-containing protein [Saprospiraceae bacterium]
MKKIFLFALLGFFTSLQVFSQEKIASPKMTADNALLKVVYGAPSKKGRNVFGGLEPYGKVWRTGANEATEITFKKDVMFGDKSVKAGTYTLFTIPTEKEWTIILNSELHQWGAYGYDKVKDKDVAQIKVTPTALMDVQELFVIKPTDKGFDIVWDKTSVSVPVK